MKKIAFFFSILLFMGTLVANAQTRVITGKVTSAEDNAPIPGVSIAVQGTTLGTVSDIEGNFTLQVPEDARTLVFSFVGMATQEVSIVGRTTVNVALESQTIGVDEVIVVAYGTTTREAKTGSAAQVQTAQLSETPVVSIDKALSGKVPGLMVTTSGGQPGSNSSIRIRGTSSVNAGNEPLYVVDGIPVMTGDQTMASTTSNALYLLNPSDIESITVLKDAAAASIYGSRAANGVILVTTKSGKSGEAKINFRASAGSSQLANDNNFKPMNSQEIWQYLRDAVVNTGRDPDDPAGYGNTYFPKSLLAGPQTNWLKSGLRNGKTQKYELTASGGTERLTNYFSAAYEDIEGIVIGNNYEKLNFRVNNDFQALEKVKIGSKLGLSRMVNEDVSTGGLSFLNPFFGAMTILPWTPMYNEDGSFNTDIPENLDVNPLFSALTNESWDKQFRLQGTGYLEYKPIEQLTLKTNNSAELTTGEARQFGQQVTGYTQNFVYSSRYDHMLLTTSNTARYSDSFLNKHIYSLLAGQEAQSYRDSYLDGESPNINIDIPYPTTSTQAEDQVGYDEAEYTMLSFFGILDYNFDSKYYLQASIRYDGSSRFGSNHKHGTFWSVGGSWNMNEEGFIRNNLDWLKLAKIRASYGVNGNNQIGNYLQYGVYGTREYNASSGMAPDQLGNADLTWELNKTYNFGLDLNFFDRLYVTFDYYKRFTEDMLLEDRLSLTTGFDNLMRNVGSMTNTGQELSISGDIVKQRDFNIVAGVNVAHNKTEITDLAGEDEIGTYRVHKVGYSLWTFKLNEYAGVNPVNGEALWYDEEGRLTNDYNKSRKVYGGTPEPKFIGGGYLNALWKGLSLVASFDYKTGHHIDVMNEGRYLRSDGYNWVGNHVNTSLDYWKQPGDITETPKPTVGNSSESNAFLNTRWLEAGDYLRLKEVTLAYDLPASLMNSLNFMEKIRIYASAYNVYTFHSLNTFDPERGNDGHAYGIYPTAKNFIFGVELSF
jgi:TonB-linked SusC/RagA family outer membrane protein